MRLEGGCLCGELRFAVAGPAVAALYCHCFICRKAHGSASVPFMVVRRKHFHWTRGPESEAAYAISRGFTRRFCARCGAPIAILEDWNPAGVTLAMGCVDGDPGIRPERHIFAASAPAWSAITDTLPQSAAWPDGLGRQAHSS